MRVKLKYFMKKNTIRLESFDNVKAYVEGDLYFSPLNTVMLVDQYYFVDERPENKDFDVDSSGLPIYHSAYKLVNDPSEYNNGGVAIKISDPSILHQISLSRTPSITVKDEKIFLPHKIDSKPN